MAKKILETERLNASLDGSARIRLVWYLLTLVLMSAVFAYSCHIYTDYFYLKDYNYLVNNVELARQHCTKLEKSLRQTTYSLELYEQTHNSFYAENRQKEWQMVILPLQGELLKNSVLWRNKTSASLVYSLAIRANHLLNAQNTLENKIKQNPELVTQQDHDRLYAVVTDADEIVTLILNEQKLEIDNLVESTAHYRHLMWWVFTPIYILLVAAHAIISLGVLLGRAKNQMAQLYHFLQSLNKGDLPNLLPPTDSEMMEIYRCVNLLRNQLECMRDFSLEIGKENFDVDFDAFEAGSDLDLAFLQMRDSLKSLEARDKEIAWSVGGVAHFATILRQKTSSLQQLCHAFASETARYLGVQQLIIYLADLDNEELSHVHAQSFYAHQQRKYINLQVEVGEGLVGQCLFEKKTLLIKNVPLSYTRINSGLGEALPRILLIQPLMVGDRLIGVLEIGSFKNLKPIELEFIEKICENFASIALATHVFMNTQNLLDVSQKNAESIAAQDREMRRQMEELHAAQKLAASKEAEIKLFLKQADKREKELQDHIAELEKQKEELENQAEADKERMEMYAQEQNSHLEKIVQVHRKKENDMKLRIQELENKLKK